MNERNPNSKLTTERVGNEIHIYDANGLHVGVDFASGNDSTVINGVVQEDLRKDSYRVKASRFYGVPYEEVTNEQRIFIKEREFGAIYSSTNLTLE